MNLAFEPFKCSVVADMLLNEERSDRIKNSYSNSCRQRCKQWNNDSRMIRDPISNVVAFDNLLVVDP